MKKLVRILGGELVPLEKIRGIEFVKSIEGSRTYYTFYLEICNRDQFWKLLDIPMRFSRHDEVMKFGKRESYVKLTVNIVENATREDNKEQFMNFVEIAKKLIEKQRSYFESIGEIIAL